MNARSPLLFAALCLFSCVGEPVKNRAEPLSAPPRTQASRADPEFSRSAFLCRASGGLLRVGVDGSGTWWSAVDSKVPFKIDMALPAVRVWCMTVGTSGDDVIILWEGRGLTDVTAGASRLVARRGDVRWATHIPTGDLGDPLLTEEAFYFSGWGLVGRVDAESGRAVWQRALESRVSMDRPRVERGRVVFRDLGGNALAELDPESGEPR